MFENVPLLNKLKGGQTLLFLGILGWWVYMMVITSPVPNYNNATNTVIYNAESHVIKNGVTPIHILVGETMIIALVLSFTVKKEEFLDENQARAAIKADFDYKKDVLHDPLFQGTFEIGESMKLKRIYKDDGTSRAIKWFGNVKRTNEDMDTFYMVSIDPHTGMIEDRLIKDKALDAADVCPGCGKLYDVKVSYPDLERIREMGFAMGRR